MNLIDKKGLQQVTGLPLIAVNALLFLLKAHKLEAIYQSVDAESGLELIEQVLDLLNIDIEFDEQLLDALPKTGGFLTISNHPFGFLDGIILLLLIGRKRNHFKVTANFLLNYFEPLTEQFITVNPFEDSGPKNLNGKQQVLHHLQQGLGVGLFPAGEVSTYYPEQESNMALDKEWGLNTMALIKEAGVPVFPIFFDGENSRSFHQLGRISPMLRTLRIPAEFLKKENTKIRVRMGDQIKDISIQQSDTEELASTLKARVYDLK